MEYFLHDKTAPAKFFHRPYFKKNESNVKHKLRKELLTILIIHQRDWIKNHSITFFSNSVRPLQEERLLFPGETPSRSVLLRKFDNLNELLESYILT